MVLIVHDLKLNPLGAGSYYDKVTKVNSSRDLLNIQDFPKNFQTILKKCFLDATCIVMYIKRSNLSPRTIVLI